MECWQIVQLHFETPPLTTIQTETCHQVNFGDEDDDDDDDNEYDNDDDNEDDVQDDNDEDQCGCAPVIRIHLT